MSSRRGLVLAVAVVVLLAGGLLVDHQVGRAGPTAPLAAARPVGAPVASPSGALSSTWYCPGGQSAPDQAASTSVALANPTGHEATGRILVLPAQGDPLESPVTVPPRGQTVVDLATVFGGPVVAGASVDLDQGGVVVQQTVKVPEGTIVAPCSSSASTTWYTAAGSTGRDADLLLSVLNPFPDDAIVDLSFATDQGGAAPAELQGIVVPNRHLVVVDVGDKVRRRDAVSASVNARRGRVVVGKVQRRGSSSTSTLAAPVTSPSWFFASGGKLDGLTDGLQLFNPSAQDASVTVELNLDKGAVEPLSVTVPAGGRGEVVVSASTGIGKGVGYAATVQSADGVGIVAERTFLASSPLSRPGSDIDELGMIGGAGRWVSAAGDLKGSDSLAIVNLGIEPATITFLVLDGKNGPVPGVEPMTVPSGARGTVALDGHLTQRNQAVLVESDQPVLVDRGGFDPAGPVSSFTPAVPLP